MANTTKSDCFQAAALRLMTHYVLHPTPEAAAAVVRLLDECAHDAADNPVMKKSLARILADWRWLAATNQQADPLHGWRIASGIMH